MKKLSLILALTFITGSALAAPTKAKCTTYTRTELGNTPDGRDIARNLQAFEFSFDMFEGPEVAKFEFSDSGVKFFVSATREFGATSATNPMGVYVNAKLGAKQKSAQTVWTQQNLEMNVGQNPYAILSVDSKITPDGVVQVLVECKAE